MKSLIIIIIQYQVLINFMLLKRSLVEINFNNLCQNYQFFEVKNPQKKKYNNNIISHTAIFHLSSL